VALQHLNPQCPRGQQLKQQLANHWHLYLEHWQLEQCLQLHWLEHWQLAQLRVLASGAGMAAGDTSGVPGTAGVPMATGFGVPGATGSNVRASGAGQLVATAFDLALVSGVAALHRSLAAHCLVSLALPPVLALVLVVLGQLGLPSLQVPVHAAAVHQLGQHALDEASSQCAECGQWLGLPLFSC